MEAVETELVFLHAAIAEHFDLAAGHAFGRKRVRVVARRFLGQEHRQALVVRRLRVRARQQRHHMGPGRVRDPGFIASYLIIVAIFHRARAQRTKVRAGVRFREDGCGQGLGAGDPREPFFFLGVRPACDDQFGRDFRPRAERAHADIAARQLFRNDAHRGFGQPKATEFFWDRQTKNAHFCQFIDDFNRDQLVLQVPFVGKWFHFFNSVTTELFADHLQLFVKASPPDGDVGALLLHEFDKARACSLRIASLLQCRDAGIGKRVLIFGRDAKIMQAQNFPLVHLNAAGNLAQVFAECDLMDQLFCFGKRAICVELLCP